MTTTLEREYLTVSEAARLLRLHVGTVYRAVESGRLPVVRLDERVSIRIPHKALEAHFGKEESDK